MAKLATARPSTSRANKMLGVAMKIQRGTVYMSPLGAECMGAIPNRMWWKPWMWQVELLPWDIRETNEYIVRNLTMYGAIGVMKLYGIKHQDFEERT